MNKHWKKQINLKSCIYVLILLILFSKKVSSINDLNYGSEYECLE